MNPSRRWFDRSFSLRLPVESFPGILERLHSAPSRIAGRVLPLPAAILVRRPGESWSIQEHVGHLLDLEPLWLGRLEDMLNGVNCVRAADLRNRGTDEARHNERAVADLLDGFRAARETLVRRLEGLEQAQLTCEALHPRLMEPMSVVGMCFFVAEHDDHHLATIEDRIATASDATG